MKQYSRLFRRSYLGDDSTDMKLNAFLNEHPNYVVDKVSFDSGNITEVSPSIVYLHPPKRDSLINASCR